GPIHPADTVQQRHGTCRSVQVGNGLGGSELLVHAVLTGPEPGGGTGYGCSGRVTNWRTAAGSNAFRRLAEAVMKLHDDSDDALQLVAVVVSPNVHQLAGEEAVQRRQLRRHGSSALLIERAQEFEQDGRRLAQMRGTTGDVRLFHALRRAAKVQQEVLEHERHKPLVRTTHHLVLEVSRSGTGT